jgi:hypothetical protein
VKSTLSRLLRTLATRIDGGESDADAAEYTRSDLRAFAFNMVQQALARPGVYAQTSGELEAVVWTWVTVLGWATDREDLHNEFRATLAKILGASQSVASTRDLPPVYAAVYLKHIWEKLWRSVQESPSSAPTTGTTGSSTDTKGLD